MADFDLATPYNELIDIVQPILSTTGFRKAKLHRWDGEISANVKQIDIIMSALLTYVNERSGSSEFSVDGEMEQVEAARKGVDVMRNTRQLLQGMLNAQHHLTTRLREQTKEWTDLDNQLDPLRGHRGKGRGRES
jgi:hypothetical protein